MGTLFNVPHELGVQIVERRRCGDSWTEIESKFGLSAKTAKAHLKRLGLLEAKDAARVPRRESRPEVMWERPCLKCGSKERRGKYLFMCKACRFENEQAGLPNWATGMRSHSGRIKAGGASVPTGVRSGRGSKAKGAAYERELAEYLNTNLALKSRRALLSGGGRNEGGSDLDDTPAIHVEAKRTETVNVRAALRQAEVALEKKASLGINPEMPVVMTRQNGMSTEDSLVVMRLKDWKEMYRSFLERRPQ